MIRSFSKGALLGALVAACCVAQSSAGGERLRLRANFDVFNVFNNQGLNVPASDGISSLANSYGGFGFRPRQVQITMRLEW